MAWYKTGTLSIAANSKKVTGHGTRWADNKQGIGPGQMLLLPGMGSVVLYEIDRVVSNTELLLVTGPQIAVKELSYAIVTYNGGSYVDFGRELSAQLRYYQRQMDGWQHIMTGEGEVTLEAPDGTQVTLSSFKKLTADVASKVDKSALDDKADKAELAGKADKAELEKKADKTALENKLDKAGGTVTGALHVTHSVNVGDVDSGLIANGDGSVALYAQGVKTGEWNTNRLHWVQNLEVGGNLTATGATFGGNITVSWGGRTATFHENGDVTGPIWGGALSGWLNNTFSKKIDDYGAIGSYVLAFCQAGNTGPNREVQGTELRASTAGGNISGDPLPGKWRCMGNMTTHNGAHRTTLWERIS